jgi:hypothetical protein
VTGQSPEAAPAGIGAESARARAESEATLNALHGRILAVLGPRRRRLAEAVMAEIEQEAIDRMTEVFVSETRIRSMDFRNGAAMDLEPSRTLAATWVGAARGMLTGAPNYSETEVDFGLADPPGVEMTVGLGGEERYVFRVQRRGKLTPHQARQRAEARAEAAEAKLAAIEATCRNPEQAVGRRMGGIHVPGDRLAEHVLAIIGSEGGDRG